MLGIIIIKKNCFKEKALQMSYISVPLHFKCEGAGYKTAKKNDLYNILKCRCEHQLVIKYTAGFKSVKAHPFLPLQLFTGLLTDTDFFRKPSDKYIRY